MENLINDAVKPTESSSDNGKHGIESGQNGNEDEQNDTEDANKQLDSHSASPKQLIPENEPELLVTDNTKPAVEYAPTSPTTVELEVTFMTEKCGKHDARLISAIENHDMGGVVRICSQSPEVRNSCNCGQYNGVFFYLHSIAC